MERFVDVPGGRLFVVSEGDGPPLVLIHAGIADLRAWDALVPPLVAAGYQAIRYDMRGAGRTTTGDVEFSNRADVMAALDALYPSGRVQAAFVLKLRGFEVLDEEGTLERVGAEDGSIFLLTHRRRRPVS